MRSDALAPSLTDIGLLPIMQTDVTTRRPGHALVIDAKYYSSHLAANQFGIERLISPHLYQLRSYLAHVRLKERASSISGMLLYPQNGQRADLHNKLFGNAVTVASINLAAEWKEIQHGLLDLVRIDAQF